MRVLVVDDTPDNLASARLQLQGHELTCSAKFSEAEVLIKSGGWDVVLTDLMMPGQSEGLGSDGDPYIGEPTPYGFVLALAAMKAGVPMVAIVSDGNHHHHPIFWACDVLSAGRGKVVPGLWSFTGYQCPMDAEGKVKSWRTVLDRISKAE